MGFPNTPVIETFTGADGTTPPNSNWTNGIQSGASNVEINGNAARTAGAGSGSAYWNAYTVSGDHEVYATIATRTDDYFGVWTFVQQPSNVSATTDGYVLYARGRSGLTDELRLYRVDNNVLTQLGATYMQEFVNGDKFGLAVSGSTFSIMFCPVSTGVWSAVATRTDSTYTSGYIGIEVPVSGKMDDFGGGVLGGGRSAVMAVSMRRRRR